MKYKHYSIFKRGVLHWLSDADLDYMANNEGWLLVTKLVDGDTTEYIFRKEIQETDINLIKEALEELEWSKVWLGADREEPFTELDSIINKLKKRIEDLDV